MEVGTGEGHTALQRRDTLGHTQQHAREYNTQKLNGTILIVELGKIQDAYSET